MIPDGESRSGIHFHVFFYTSKYLFCYSEIICQDRQFFLLDKYAEQLNLKWVLLASCDDVDPTLLVARKIHSDNKIWWSTVCALRGRPLATIFRKDTRGTRGTRERCVDVHARMPRGACTRNVRSRVIACTYIMYLTAHSHCIGIYKTCLCLRTQAWEKSRESGTSGYLMH